MAVTAYSYLDASAPALTNTAGSLIGVLDACLVNGYGSKSSLGWTKEYSGTNTASYRAPAGTRPYLWVGDTSTTATQLRGYMTMTTATDAGLDGFPTTTQATNGEYFYKSAAAGTNRPWFLVGDGKRFHLFAANSLADFPSSLNTTAISGMFFGDIISYLPGDSYCAAIFSAVGTTATSSWYNALNSYTAISAHYMCRDYTQTGTSLQFCKSSSSYGTSTAIGSIGSTYPDPATGGMLMSRVVVVEPTTKVVRGHIPGLWNPHHVRPGTPEDTFSGKAGTSLAGRTFIIMPSVGSANGNVVLETSDTWD